MEIYVDIFRNKVIESKLVKIKIILCIDQYPTGIFGQRWFVKWVYEYRPSAVTTYFLYE